MGQDQPVVAWWQLEKILREYASWLIKEQLHVAALKLETPQCIMYSG